MNRFLEKIKENIISNDLIKPNLPIIIGISGGVDSMVLLDVLYRLKYPIVMAHVNFQLRGKDSNRDEMFVTQIAEKFKIPLEKKRFNTQKYSKKNRISIEMAARELRYQWFEELSNKYNTENIAVAHHADDNIETLFLNLIRGTGIRGLTGMKVRNGKIIRPFLSVFRSEIEQYAQNNSIQYVIDSTNLENIYVRNKIRNNIIPLLEDINPSVRKILNNNILNFEKTSEFYFYHIKKAKDIVLRIENDIISINISKLQNMEYANIVLYEILSDYQFSPNTIDDIFSKLNEQSGLEFLSTTYRLIKDRDYLLIKRIENREEIEYQIERECCEIKEPFGLKIRWIKRDLDFKFSTDPNIIHIDKSKLIFPLFLRRWRQGDVFQPIGMEHFKKVSDFLIDEKISRMEKENIWILCNGNNHIIWLVGKRIDNRFKITDKTTEIIELKI